MLLVNAAARRVRARGAEVITSCPVAVRVLEPGENLATVALEEAARGPEVLGIAGGDGSLAPVVAAALAYDVPFTVVPLGTRNHFARDAGFNRRRPLEALRALEPGAREVRVDVGRVSGRLFLNNVSLGVYADLVRQQGWREHKLAVVVRNRIEGGTILLVANNAYGPGTRRPRLDTGQLQVCRIEVSGPVDLALQLARVVARGASPDECIDVQRFHLEGDAPEITAAIDGEPVLLPAPLEFTIRPRALRLRLP